MAHGSDRDDLGDEAPEDDEPFTETEPVEFRPIYAQVFPWLDLPKMAGQFKPPIDQSLWKNLAPPFDYEQISQVMPTLKVPDELIRRLIPDLGETLKAFEPYLDRLRENLPPNWPHGIDFDLAAEVIQQEGLPLVWVPREEIVDALLAAADRAARVQLLVERRNDVVDDCRAVLADIDHQPMANQLPLCAKAVDAFAAGHHESAQALAVVVTETVVAKAIPGSTYNDIKEQVKFDPKKVTMSAIRLAAALAPIAPFYTSWWPSSNEPPPEGLSRHVTVHQADHEQYTPGHAVVAVLLACSVLRAIQDRDSTTE